jgi:hypothetical protein
MVRMKMEDVSLGKHSLGDLLKVPEESSIAITWKAYASTSVLCFMLVDKCKLSATTPVLCLPAWLPATMLPETMAMDSLSETVTMFPINLCKLPCSWYLFTATEK